LVHAGIDHVDVERDAFLDIGVPTAG
jgi:hypothetical protein